MKPIKLTEEDLELMRKTLAKPSYLETGLAWLLVVGVLAGAPYILSAYAKYWAWSWGLVQ